MLHNDLSMGVHELENSRPGFGLFKCWYKWIYQKRNLGKIQASKLASLNSSRQSNEGTHRASGEWMVSWGNPTDAAMQRFPTEERCNLLKKDVFEIGSQYLTNDGCQGFRIHVRYLGSM